MRLGDALELVGIAGLAVAAYLAAGIAAGLGVAAIGLVYEGQCYGHISLPGLMEVLGETRDRRIAALEAQVGVWPGKRPPSGDSESALRAEALWLEDSVRFQNRLGIEVGGLLTELQRTREAVKRIESD